MDEGASRSAATGQQLTQAGTWRHVPSRDSAPPCETVYPIADRHWLIVVGLGGDRYRLDRYLQEEELAPPLLLDSTTIEVSNPSTKADLAK
jgi:hypothetical protein